MSRDFEEDYQFFLRHKDKFNFTTRFSKPVVYKQGALGARKSFIGYLQGNKYPRFSSEPELLHELLLCRLTILTFIKDAAEHKSYRGKPIAYFMANFDAPPRWVLSMFIREVNIHWN